MTDTTPFGQQLVSDVPEEELIRHIQRLRSEKNAVILAHNYQVSSVQDIADLTKSISEMDQQMSEATENR